MKLQRIIRHSLKNQMFLLTIIICLGVCLFVLSACNKGGGSDNLDNDDKPQIEVVEVNPPSYDMSFDTRQKSAVIFSFKPQYSGKYALTYNSDDLTVTVEDEIVESGDCRYYNKNLKYYIKFDAQQTVVNIAQGYLRPLQYDEEDIEIRDYNDAIVKFTPTESGLYQFETDGLYFKVMNELYETVEKAADNVVFLKKDEYNSFYYVVLSNNTARKYDSVDLSIEKMNLQTISLEESNQEVSMPISGNAGDVQFYLLDVCLEMNCTMWLNLNGDMEIKCYIYDACTYTSGFIKNQIVGSEYCGYKCAFDQQAYILKIEFREDKEAQLHFVH
ncbi:MAG: hypothetical protein NC037_03290 [Bacteroides sp.]|nr:hypothetical protein [Bacillota bacterium]MCM1393385.1 hypothetical protein [[Eubacterium] siraeum]MCM1455533.1 hypothetical protein [Bacteroides sp.]